MWTQIITALLVGLLTAFAFQLLLTSLGVAIGLTTLSFHFTTSADSKPEFTDPEASDLEVVTTSSTSRIGTFAGLGILLTINMVLSGACFLAVKFSQVDSPISGAIAGIVIWSAYFLILTWVSSTAVSSLIGSVLSSATGGFRRLVTTITAAFKEEDETPLTQEQAIAIIRQEIQQTFSPAALDQLVQHSLDQHPIVTEAEKPHPVVMSSALLQEIPGLAEQLSSRSKPNVEPVEPIVEQFQQLAAEPIAGLSSEFPSQFHEDRTAPLWKELELYLSHTKLKQFTTEQIQHKLETLLEEGWESSSHHTEPFTFDRARMKALLKQQRGLDKKQRQRILRYVEISWNQMMEKSQVALAEKSQPATDPHAAPLNSLQPIATYVTESLQHVGDQLSAGKNSLEAILPQNLSQRLSIASIANWAIQQQLNQIDWGSLLERLPLQNLDQAQIEQIVAKVRTTAQDLVSKPQQWTEAHLVPQTEDLKNQVVQQVDQFQHNIQQQIDDLKQQAQRRLESTRKAAAAAAWWLSATAFTAAMSAALSGALAAGLYIKFDPGVYFRTWFH